jgi:hypothetical protein
MTVDLWAGRKYQDRDRFTRREFAREALKSLTAIVLIEGLWSLENEPRPLYPADRLGRGMGPIG